MNQQYSNDEAHAADPQVVRQRGMRILEQRTSEGPVPTNITVVKHFSPGVSTVLPHELSHITAT